MKYKFEFKVMDHGDIPNMPGSGLEIELAAKVAQAVSPLVKTITKVDHAFVKCPEGIYPIPEHSNPFSKYEGSLYAYQTETMEEVIQELKSIEASVEEDDPLTSEKIKEVIRKLLEK